MCEFIHKQFVLQEAPQDKAAGINISAMRWPDMPTPAVLWKTARLSCVTIGFMQEIRNHIRYEWPGPKPHKTIVYALAIRQEEVAA
jgi:hypothetical protein